MIKVLILSLISLLSLSLSLSFSFSLIQQTVMAEQYPQSLLILDDVWESETAQAFSIRCRTLITSRNADIANGIQTNNVYKVSIMEVSLVMLCGLGNRLMSNRYCYGGEIKKLTVSFLFYLNIPLLR